MSKKTHGESRTKLYRKWASMLCRCNDKHDPRYKSYGGRGITVCEEWRQSYEIYRDYLLGLNPNARDLLESGYEVDRIDNDGNYEPGNIRIVPKIVNSRNRSCTSKVLDLDGKTEISFKDFWEQYALPDVKYGVAYKRYFVRKSLSTSLKACRTSSKANCPEKWLVPWEDYWISTAEYARRIGVSKSSVVRAMQANMSVEDFINRKRHVNGG